MKKYPEVRTVGHRDIEKLLDGPVVVQEKVDGSNFSFGKMPDGQLFAWSHNNALDLKKPDRMFQKAIDHVQTRAHVIPKGIIYRCEYLSKPKHNVLAYARVPKNHLVLYEVEYFRGNGIMENRGHDRPLLELIAATLDIDVIPEMLSTPCLTREELPGLVAVWHGVESFLGGPKMEGVVIKNFTQTNERSGAPYLVGKIVRQEFKECHQAKVKLDKPGQVSTIGARFGGPARWQKAVQFCQEAGALTGSMEDMPALLKRVQVDVEAEEMEEIKEALYKLYRKNVLGCTTRGLAEWYKQKLNDEFTEGGSLI